MLKQKIKKKKKNQRRSSFILKEIRGGSNYNSSTSGKKNKQQYYYISKESLSYNLSQKLFLYIFFFLFAFLPSFLFLPFPEERTSHPTYKQYKCKMHHPSRTVDAQYSHQPKNRHIRNGHIKKFHQQKAIIPVP